MIDPDLQSKYDALVAKPLKTADGVTVVPGSDNVYWSGGVLGNCSVALGVRADGYVVHGEHRIVYHDRHLRVSDCHSTPTKAREEREG